MKPYEFIGYSAELSNFLGSVTVKWSGLSDMINEKLTENGVSVGIDPLLWKYYQNLAGERHSSDPVLTVISLDTQETIEFTRANLLLHPLTMGAYQIGSEYYDTLMRSYPDMSDYIRCTVYPTGLTVAETYTAVDFSLIGYGTSILESYEVAPAIQTLKEHLAYVKSHVYREVLGIEEYYRHTFWGNMWLCLLAALYAMRAQHIKGPYTHTYFVWEYLKSFGLSDYQDTLTRKQAMWLYRNIRYIRENQGTQHVMLLIANNLLSPLGMSLVARLLYHHTLDTEGLLWESEFVADVLPTDYSGTTSVSAPLSMATLTSRLKNAGYDVDTSADYIAKQMLQVNATPVNIMPTKVLEIQPLTMFKRHSNTVARILHDTLVRYLASGRYNPVYQATDYTSGVYIDLSGIDILHLITYAAFKYLGTAPKYVPEWYVPHLGSKRDSKPTLATTLTIGAVDYIKDDLIDTSDLMGSNWFSTMTFEQPAHFSGKASLACKDLINMVRTYQANPYPHVRKVIQSVWSDLVVTDTIRTAATGALYSDWLEAKGLTSLATAYDQNDDAATLWSNLMTTLFTFLLPQTNFMTEIMLDTNRTKTYERIIDLMKELCSYNVLFLNSDSIVELWLGYQPVEAYVTAESTSGTITINNLSLTALPVDESSAGAVDLVSDISVITPTDVSDTTAEPIDIAPDISVREMSDTGSVDITMSSTVTIMRENYTSTQHLGYPGMRLTLISSED